MAAAVTSGVVALMIEANRGRVRRAADAEHGEGDPRIHGAAALHRRCADARSRWTERRRRRAARRNRSIPGARSAIGG